MKLRRRATDEEILQVIRDRVGLLAQERYDDAWAFLHPPRDPYYSHLTADVIRKLINNYGWVEPPREYTGITFVVTPLEEAVLPEGIGGPVHEVDRFEDENDTGAIWFDLPLNGEWSDVTATF